MNLFSVCKCVVSHQGVLVVGVYVNHWMFISCWICIALFSCLAGCSVCKTTMNKSDLIYKKKREYGACVCHAYGLMCMYVSTMNVKIWVCFSGKYANMCVQLQVTAFLYPIGNSSAPAVLWPLLDRCLIFMRKTIIWLCVFHVPLQQPLFKFVIFFSS